MTRINLIPVSELTDQHLLAEHREIKRIPNVILKGKFNLDNIPDKYTMGTGHVKFFYNKLDWLVVRYLQLKMECNLRGFNVTNYIKTFIQCIKDNPSLAGYYEPSKEDVVISRQRINEKIQLKPKWYKHYGKLIL